VRDVDDVLTKRRERDHLECSAKRKSWETRSCRATAIGLSAALCIAVVSGCGSSSEQHAVPLNQLTPRQAATLVKSLKPECNKTGRVLIRSSFAPVHGETDERWWCVEPARAYHVVQRDLHCPRGSRLVIDFARYVASCKHPTRARR
jgi:hypothetical protein